MKNKKGISLIVLVITIIVMIILASAVMITLSNAGIISKSQDAAEEANLKEAQDIAALAWSDWYLNERANLNNGVTAEEYIRAALANNGIANVDIYDLEITDYGVEVKKPSWKVVKTFDDAGTKVTSAVVKKGTQTISVGSVVSYAPNGINDYNGKWAVLGADSEGRILITTMDVPNKQISINSIEDIETSITRMNELTQAYKDGKYGVSARSIDDDDINAITGYDKTKYTGYGQKVQINWDDLSPNNCDGYCHDSIAYYDQETGKVLYASDNIDYDENAPGCLDSDGNIDDYGSCYVQTKEPDQPIVENTYYSYDIASHIDTNIKEFNMLFGGEYECIDGDEESCNEGIFHYKNFLLPTIYNGIIDLNYIIGILAIDNDMYSSNVYLDGITLENGEANPDVTGFVRPVVTLSADVQLTLNNITGEYDLK